MAALRARALAATLRTTSDSTSSYGIEDRHDAVLDFLNSISRAWQRPRAGRRLLLLRPPQSSLTSRIRTAGLRTRLVGKGGKRTAPRSPLGTGRAIPKNRIGISPVISEDLSVGAFRLNGTGPCEMPAAAPFSTAGACGRDVPPPRVHQLLMCGS